MPSDTQDQLSFGKYRTRINAMIKTATEGAAKDMEMPMLIGGMMPLSGQRAAKEPLHSRKVVEVTKTGFDNFMGQIGPELTVQVDDKLSGKEDAKRKVKLTFTHMDDFGPMRVAQTVPELAALLQIRRQLDQLAANLEGKPATERQLADVLGELKKQLPEKR
jgi:type VI secretion system protein ImpB